MNSILDFAKALFMNNTGNELGLALLHSGSTG